MTLVLFIGIALCSYRITRLFTKDSLFDGPRKRWFKRFPPDTAHARIANTKSISKWGQLVQCPFCIGFWVSGLVVLVVAQCVDLPLPLLWWFATSTAVGLIARADG